MKNELRQAIDIEKALEDAIFEYYYKAYEHFDQGDTATAETAILKAWELIPEPKYNTACTTMVLTAMQEMLPKTGKLTLLETLFAQWTHDIETCGYTVHNAEPFVLFAEIYLFLNQIDKAKEQFAKAKKYKISKRAFAEKPAFYYDIVQGKITDNQQIAQLFKEAVQKDALSPTLDELDEITLEKIDEWAESGNAFFDDEKYHEAISQWQKGLALIPEPQLHYAQSQWFFASIGDAFFALKDYQKALQNFEQAKGNIVENGYHNPFICLRLGQCYLEQGDTQNAQEFLLRAYMFEGKEFFAEDDPKYFEFLQQNVQNIQ